MGIFDSLFSGFNSFKNGNFTGMKDTKKVPDFKEEFSMDTSFNTQGKDVVFYQDNGVQFYNVPNMLKIVYSGTLAKSGSQDIYAAIGYGDNLNWEDTEYPKMSKTLQDTYELLTLRKKPGNVNVAFKDSADNWDNNEGENYIFYDKSNEGSH